MCAQRVHLYYFPSSFYSQRVLVALAEKKIPYTETVVDSGTHEHLFPWYLRLNPQGQVPLIKLGEKLINESENIVDVLDTLESSEDFKLVPDASSPTGKLVEKWRKKLNAILVEDLTYGVILHNELSPGGFSRLFKFASSAVNSVDKYNKKINGVIAYLEQIKKENPDLSKCIDNILVRQKARVYGSRYGPENVKGKLEELDGIMDEVEEQLIKSQAGSEHWLCGPSFTVADIHLCTLLGRLWLTGLVGRYVDPKLRPALTEYWTRAMKRPSIKNFVLGALPNAVKFMMRKKFAWFASRTIAAGVVVAAAVIIARKYTSS